MKKILLLVLLVASLTMVSPAVAQWYDDVYMDQAGINVLATGISIGPVEMAEYEKYCHYSWGESFYWGGLSIDLLAVQGITQTMTIGSGYYGYGGYGYQNFSNCLKLVTPNMYLKMEQSASQQGQSGYWYYR